MNQNKKVAIGSVIITALLLIIGFSFLKTTPIPQVQNAIGAQNTDTTACTSFNGVLTCTIRQNFNLASSTFCAIPNPFGAATSTSAVGGAFTYPTGMATSTIVDVSVNIPTPISAAFTFDIATSTSQTATTSKQSIAYAVSVGANGQFADRFMPGAYGSATSSDTRLTSSLSAGNGLFTPASFILVKPATTTSWTNYNLTGAQCIVTVRGLSSSQ